MLYVHQYSSPFRKRWSAIGSQHDRQDNSSEGSTGVAQQSQEMGKERKAISPLTSTIVGSNLVAASASKAPLVGGFLAKFLALAPPTCFFFLQTSP